jgi:hypothetical protein
MINQFSSGWERTEWPSGERSAIVSSCQLERRASFRAPACAKRNVAMRRPSHAHASAQKHGSIHLKLIYAVNIPLSYQTTGTVEQIDRSMAAARSGNAHLCLQCSTEAHRGVQPELNGEYY